MKNITYQIRLPDSLRDEFLSTCKNNGLTGSSVLKHFMIDYISKNKAAVHVPKPKPKSKLDSYFDENGIEQIVTVEELEFIINKYGHEWLDSNHRKYMQNNGLILSEQPLNIAKLHENKTQTKGFVKKKKRKK